MNSRIAGIEECDLMLIVGSNTRLEAPVMNARILKATQKGLKVAVVGTPIDLTYDYMHLGSSTDVLKQIAEGTHPFSDRLKKAQMPMIILGSSLLERSDADVKFFFVLIFFNLF